MDSGRPYLPFAGATTPNAHDLNAESRIPNMESSITRIHLPKTRLADHPRGNLSRYV